MAETDQKNDPSDEQESGRGPPNIESRPQFMFLSIHQYWIIEVSDDGVAHPAHGDKCGQTRKQKQTPRKSQGDVFSLYVVVTAAALLGSTCRDEQGDDD